MADAGMICPCGSGREYAACCGPIVAGEKPAPTAEALMRSRYTAYAVGEIEHLARTLVRRKRPGFDPKAAKQWSESANWLGLEVLDTVDGGEGDERGEVEFVARFSQAGEGREHRERGRFVRENGQWRYLDGQRGEGKTVVRDAPKVGRNAPCPCGSGKKHKKCCGR